MEKRLSEPKVTLKTLCHFVVKELSMNCIICRQAETTHSFTSITFERDEFKLVIHNIPAQVCPNCGEAIVNEDVALQLISQAEDSFAQGLIEDIREY